MPPAKWFQGWQWCDVHVLICMCLHVVHLWSLVMKFILERTVSANFLGSLWCLPA